MSSSASSSSSSSNSQFKKANKQFDMQLLSSSSFELIKQGAEAKLYRGLFQCGGDSVCSPQSPAPPPSLVIVKERFRKTYRQPDLDRSLTVRRIKNEVKMLAKAGGIGVRCPVVHQYDLASGVIVMQYIDEATTLRDYVIGLSTTSTAAKKRETSRQADVTDTVTDTDTDTDRISEVQSKLDALSLIVGDTVGKLHREHIIHGDLTTSNMLIRRDQQDSVYFIDFGLSVVSSQLEEKAVDLYVLERALQSTHSVEAARMFKHILSGYALGYGAGAADVLERLEQVRLRGRKRDMIG